MKAILGLHSDHIEVKKEVKRLKKRVEELEAENGKRKRDLKWDEKKNH